MPGRRNGLSLRSRVFGALALVALLSAPLARAGTQDEATPAIRYTTVFVNPPATGGPDLAIENYIVAQIDAAPPGSEIGFAVRDWTVQRVAQAVVRAFDRGVRIEGVIDGGERNRPFLIDMVNHIGGGVIFCGQPEFRYFSCISNVLEPGLMHNKFWTFSELPDGSRNVVLETSQNFTAGQRGLFQDLVRIDGDAALYDGYRQYLDDMHAQRRTDDYFADHVRTGDSGRNTMYPFPRLQPDYGATQRAPTQNDTIVERLKEVDCSDGGSPTGKGLIRIAQAEFASERGVIVDELAKLSADGCRIQIINSNGDADVVAKLVNSGVEFLPMYLGTIGVTTHTKFWLVDAKSTLTGERAKIVYAGSANWRADEHQTDDLLLRVADDGVYDAYNAQWETMALRSRFTRRALPAADVVAPYVAFAATPRGTGAPAWNDTDVNVRITGSDGVGDYGGGSSGIRRLHVELSGAEDGSWDVWAPLWTPATPDLTSALTKEVAITHHGLTTVSFYGVDQKGFQSATETREVRLDASPPVVATGANDAFGTEAAELTTSGTFADADGDRLTVRKVSGAGVVTDAGDGTWTWTYTTPDDDGGTVVVEADDGLGRAVVDSFAWRADNVAPAITDFELVVPGFPACQGTANTVGVSFGVTDPAAEADDPTTGSIDWGDGATSAFSGRSLSTSHDYAAGVYSLVVSARDDDGGSDQAGTEGNVPVRYAMTRILPPMNADGSSIWRYGATIPVKVRITDCAGLPVADLAPTVASRRRSGDEPVDVVNEGSSTSAADTGSTMRFDAVAGQYVYNFATSALADPTATYFMYVREAHSLGSNAWGTPTSGFSSQKFGLK